MLHRLLMTLGPILAALVIAGAILLAVGVDPLAYYGYVLQRGLLRRSACSRPSPAWRRCCSSPPG